MKKDNQWNVLIAIRKAHLNEIKNRVRVQCTFFEPNQRRDPDNISGFAHKVILDALVDSGILQNDTQKEIAGFSDSFFVDRRNPRIEVTLIYCEMETE